MPKIHSESDRTQDIRHFELHTWKFKFNQFPQIN